MTTGLESLNLFRVQFSASSNAFAASSLFSLHIISKSKCFFVTFFSHSAIFSFQGIISNVRTPETRSLPGQQPSVCKSDDPWPCSTSISSFLLAISSFRTSIPNRILKRSLFRSTMSGNRLLFRCSKNFCYGPDFLDHRPDQDISTGIDFRSSLGIRGSKLTFKVNFEMSSWYQNVSNRFLNFV